jgi:hypothetical protein
MAPVCPAQRVGAFAPLFNFSATLFEALCNCNQKTTVLQAVSPAMLLTSDNVTQ